MKVIINEDQKIVYTMREALLKNDNYCPCIVDSKGKEEYLCMCREFLENTKVGEYCRCGLYKRID